MSLSKILYALVILNISSCMGVETKEDSNLQHYLSEGGECRHLTRNLTNAKCYRIPFALATSEDKAQLLINLDEDVRNEIEDVKNQARIQLHKLKTKIAASGANADEVQMNLEFEADEINHNTNSPKTIEYIRSRANEFVVASARKFSAGKCFPKEYKTEEFHDLLRRFDLLAKSKNYACLYSQPSIFVFKIRGFVQFGQGLNMQAYVDFLASFLPYVLVVVVDDKVVNKLYRNDKKLAIDLGSAVGVGSSAAAGLSVVAGIGKGLIRSGNHLPAIKLGLGSSLGAGPFGMTLRGYLNFDPPNRSVFATINNFLDISPPPNVNLPFVFYEASANVRFGYAATADIYFSYTLPIEQMADRLGDMIRNSRED